MKEKIIIVSGYFDPIHVGHIECLELAKGLGGKVVALLNNDKQAMMKKGKAFMPQSERKKILESLRVVDEVFECIDEDRSVCNSIRAIAEKFKDSEIVFAKGGDRFRSNIPEVQVCEELGIEIVDGLGEKIQSSSNLTGIEEIK